MSIIVRKIKKLWDKKGAETNQGENSTATKSIIRKPKTGYALTVDKFVGDIQTAYGLEHDKAREFYLNHHLLVGIMSKDGRDSISNYVSDKGTTSFTFLPVAIGMKHYGDISDKDLENKVIEIATGAIESGVRFSKESLDKIIENPQPYIEISRTYFSR